MSSAKRISITISEEDLREIDRIKQIKFYNQSYADLFRYLIHRAIEKEKDI